MTRRRAGWTVVVVLVALAMVWPGYVAAFVLGMAGLGTCINEIEASRRGSRGQR